MNIPKLKKERIVKTYHGYKLVDDYAFVDQPDILNVLKEPKNLIPSVRKYINANNKFTEIYFKKSITFSNQFI